jgi:hypothetical protein
MPLNPRGKWRYLDHIHAGNARAVRAFYREHEFKIGASAITRTKALNAGRRPPLAWDDPGTLAWPDGVPEVIEDAPKLLPRTAHRGEHLAELVARGVSLTTACRELDASADALEKWCARHDQTAAYAVLRSRETAVFEYRNGATGAA